MTRNTVLSFLVFLLGATVALAEPGFGPTPATIKGATTVTADEAAAAVEQNGRRIVIIDVRTAKEFAKGHLKGAKHMTGRWSRVVKAYRMNTKPMGKDKSAPVLIYGMSDQDRTAEVTVRQAIKEGFTNVLWMRGGYTEWVGQNRPVGT